MQTFALAIAVLAFLAVSVRDLVNRRVSVGDSWLWLCLTLLAAALLAFPQASTDLAQSLGFQVASNLIFTIAVLVLAWLLRRNSVRLSSVQAKLQDVIQELALMRHSQSKHQDAD